MYTGGQSLCKAQNEALIRDRRIFVEKLQEFPHLFQLEDYFKLTLERKKNILDRLNSERINGSNYHEPKEVTCISNFIAFLLFLTKDVETAVDETEKVLGTPNNDTNIVALANMAVMKWEMGKRVEGETFVKKLEELRGQRNFEDKVIDAKAEMAYCYSRMGMSFATLAEDTFEEVVKARPHEYTWKYGLAKILRRFTETTYILFFRISYELASQKSLRAFDLLLEIKKSKAPGGERAQALIELGLLLRLTWSKQFLRVVDRAKEERITVQRCFEEAEKLAPEDPYVLTHTGNVYNYAKQLDLSRQLLQRAIEIRPTTTSYHCLGKTLVHMSKFQIFSQWRHRFEDNAKGNCCGSEQGSESWFRRPDSERQTQKNVSSKRHSEKDAKSSKTSPIVPCSLSMDQKCVQEAIYYYKKAIEKAHGDNPKAMYDLEVLYILAGEDDQALDQFSALINKFDLRDAPLQLINAHEQAGFIYMRKKTRARNERQRQQFAAEGCRLLQAALQMECQFVSSILTCRPDVTAARPSFYDLCCVARGTKSPEHQLVELTKLFGRIKKYAKYLNVLNDISVYRSQDINDHNILERRLQSYVSRKLYDHALLVLSFLEITKERKLINQWSDLPRRCRLLAARKKLLNIAKAPSGSIDDKMIKRCFVQAIQPEFSQNDEAIQMKYVDDGWSEDHDEKWWHVMIFQDVDDEYMKVKGLEIKDILQNMCGLHVTCMADDNDDLPDDSGESRIAEKAKNSLILLVLCGTEGHSGGCSETVMQILKEARSSADCEPRTVLVLLMDNARLPDHLHPDRCLQCPSPLFGPHAPYTPELIEAMYRLCCFLADVPTDDQ